MLSVCFSAGAGDQEDELEDWDGPGVACVSEGGCNGDDWENDVGARYHQLQLPAEAVHVISTRQQFFESVQVLQVSVTHCQVINYFNRS